MNNYLTTQELLILEDLKFKREEKRKLSEIAHHLNLPIINNSDNVYVPMKDLWELFSDEKKLKELLSRIRNKAFW
jgi:hypothetical protein